MIGLLLYRTQGKTRPARRLPNHRCACCTLVRDGDCAAAQRRRVQCATKTMPTLQLAITRDARGDRTIRRRLTCGRHAGNYTTTQHWIVELRDLLKGGYSSRAFAFPFLLQKRQHGIPLSGDCLSSNCKEGDPHCRAGFVMPLIWTALNQPIFSR